MAGRPYGMIFETVLDQGLPSVIIKNGSVMTCAMRHAIAALAMQGNDLVVDDVMMREAEADEHRTLLTHTGLHSVGLFAPLGVIEAREHARGDRQPGLARWQFDRVYRGQTYDLEIETSGTTPMENARRICSAFYL